MSEKGIFTGFGPVSFISKDVDRELQRKRDQERNDAHQRAFHAVAYMQIPEDIRSRAKVYGMEAYREVLWMNAFECGYKQAMRDQR